MIELDHVTTYAFAEYDDGTCGFWAAGKAGWFEIQSPHASYKATYDKMNEAASIFYMLADKMRRAHKMYPKLSNKALNKYAGSVFQDVGRFLRLLCSWKLFWLTLHSTSYNAKTLAILPMLTKLKLHSTSTRIS